jgi:tetratricopeptide (TPR) repeat protein
MPIATEIVAERRFYLPLAAVLVAAVIGVEAARRRFAPSLPPARLAWSGVFIAAACGVATFVRGKKFNDPELLWRESIAAVPNNARAYDNLAFLLMSRHQGRLDEADTLLRKAMAVDSTFLHAWINLASIRATQGKYDEDIALLRHVLQLTPDDTLANRHLGIAYLNSDRPTEALPYIEHYVSLDSTGDGLLMLGSTLLTVGKPDSAIAALKAALGREAQRVATLGLLGSAYSEIGRPRDAEPFLRQLTVLSPASGAAWGALALNQAQLGQVDQARAAVKIAGEFAAGDPAVFIFTGRALAQLGDTRGAREQFRKALSLDPANADAASALRSLGDGPTQ